MNTTGFRRRIKPYKMLSDAEVDRIHQGTLDILEKTGATVQHERALKLLEKEGCKVNHTNRRVRFSPELIEDCLKRCPGSFILQRRGEGNDITIGDNNLVMATSCGLETVNLEDWDSRPATRQEVYDAVRVIDALEHCHMSGAYAPYWGFEGVPPIMAILEACAARIRNTVKVGWEGCLADCEKFYIDMAKAAGTEIMGQAAAASPLTWYEESVETMFTFADAGLPCMVGCGPTMGASAPATLAGATMLANAEIMSAIVLMQCYKPGTRQYAGSFVWPMNMRTGAASFGNIACSLHTAIFEQMWQHYDVATWHGAPGATNGKATDFQCGYEKSMAAMLSSLYGANVLWFVGGIHGELAWHNVQAIMDNEIAGMIGRYVEGVDIDDDHLALDLIHEIGPIPGTFLRAPHTRQWWAKEQYMNEVTDSLSIQDWRGQGKKLALDYAKEKMEEILSTHKPLPLPSGADEEIDRLLKEAREHYRKMGKISDEEWETYMVVLKENDAL